jgi:AcrR family transcriptional regulator
MPRITVARNGAGERRDAILEAARAVFAREGYADTGVQDIARQAGIGKGTLYLYFRSKEQIYLAALLEDARKLERITGEAVAAAGTWQEKVRAYIEVRLKYVDAHQDFFRIFTTEIRNVRVMGRRVEAEFYHLIEHGEAQLAQVFAAAAARGEIRAVDPEMAASAVSDLTRGLIERQVCGWGRAIGLGDAAFAFELVRRGFEA